jgi:hypothetical protein
MEYNIGYIEFLLENCESIIVPFDAFEKFRIDINENNQINAYFVIKDNGKIEYSSEWSDKTIHPIQRLAKYNDITRIYKVYNDGNSECFYVDWYDEDPNSNKNQYSKLIDYKTLCIEIKEFIQEYYLCELFDFDIGTKFKDEKGNVCELKLDENGKYLSGINSYEKYFKQKYVLIK